MIKLNMKYVEEATNIHPARLIILLVSFALAVQFIIITYTHVTGYYVNKSAEQFVFRWGINSAISFFLLALMVFPDVFVIKRLNNVRPWSKNTFSRLIIELAFVLALGAFTGTFATLIMHIINPYEQGLFVNSLNNSLIGAVINVIVAAALEGWFFYREGKISKENAELLENELSQIRFEVLKNQLNPHFLFNSLNVLSGLINSDQEKAQDFIDEFAGIYHYILETIEKKVSTLAEELDFADSYMYLQKIRYGDALIFETQISAKYLNLLLPPLSLQTALENAIKHNVLNSKNPLMIKIYCAENRVLVENNVKLKISSRNTKGLGQLNLMRRYEMISGKLPEFFIKNGKYYTVLPLLESE